MSKLYRYVGYDEDLLNQVRKLSNEEVTKDWIPFEKKVGQRYKVIDEYDSVYNEGDIITLVMVDSDGVSYYRNDVDKHRYMIDVDSLVPEVEYYDAGIVEVGDFVRLSEHNYAWDDYDPQTHHEVVSVTGNGDVRVYIDDEYFDEDTLFIFDSERIIEVIKKDELPVSDEYIASDIESTRELLDKLRIDVGATEQLMSETKALIEEESELEVFIRETREKLEKLVGKEYTLMIDEDDYILGGK